MKKNKLFNIILKQVIKLKIKMKIMDIKNY